MKQLLKLMFFLMALAGFLLLYGTVGALELDNISFAQFNKQAVISFAIFFFCVIGYRAVDSDEETDVY